MTNEIYEILLCDTVHSILSNKVMREDFTVGSSACVEFDWEFAMSQEETFGSVVGFYHTHPFSQADIVGMSSTDFDTMSAWVDCFWKPLYCLIGRSEYDKNPTVYIFAPPTKTVIYGGHVLWLGVNEYYKGMLQLPTGFAREKSFTLPYLSAI